MAEHIYICCDNQSLKLIEPPSDYKNLSSNLLAPNFLSISIQYETTNSGKQKYKLICLSQKNLKIWRADETEEIWSVPLKARGDSIFKQPDLTNQEQLSGYTIRMIGQHAWLKILSIFHLASLYSISNKPETQTCMKLEGEPTLWSTTIPCLVFHLEAPFSIRYPQSATLPPSKICSKQIL